MTADEYRQVMEHDERLAIGTQVDIRWTNSHRWYAMPATVTKVNGKSVLAAIADTVTDLHGRVLYPAGHVIKAPRITDIQGWSANNCVTPRGGWPRATALT